MSKIAILGAKGFLGSPIAEAFSRNGCEVVELSRTPSEKPNRQELVVDLFDDVTLQSALIKSKPDVVISTAWVTEHGKFWTNDSNIHYRDATLRFAEICFESEVETFIGLGTMSEYGTSPGLCNAELSSLVANDIYSKSKIETGLALYELGKKYGGRTHWARVFQAYGPNEKQERFIPGLINKLQNSEEFIIRTPDYEMDWIHSTDVASAIVYSLENSLNHFLDIGTGIGTSVRDLSEIICAELDLDESLLDFTEQIPGHEKTALVDPHTQLLSFGWRPAESLRDRIRSLR